MKKYLTILYLFLHMGLFAFDCKTDHPSMTQLAVENTTIREILFKQYHITRGTLFPMPGMSFVKRDFISILGYGSSMADQVGAGDLDHFFDPTTQLGLNDGTLSGQPALSVAQSYWHNAYDALEALLTNSEAVDREEAGGELFFRLGMTLHLLQDMADPFHTRNDGPKVPGGLNSVEYGAGYYLFQESGFSMSVTPIIFQAMEDFWMNPNFYPDPASYYPDPFNPYCSNPGLADLSNRTFFTDDSMIQSCLYPLPPLDLSLYYLDDPDYLEYFYSEPCLGRSFNAFEQTLAHKSCIEAGLCQDDVLSCTPSGEVPQQDYRLGEMAYWDTLSIMVPEAVRYSAGLLEFFFRGSMTVNLIPSNTAGYYTVEITNNSSQMASFEGGTLSIYWTKTDSGQRSLLEGATQSDFFLPNGDSITFDIPAIPQEDLEGQELAFTPFTAVYSGPLGTNDSGSFTGDLQGVVGKDFYADIDTGRIYFVTNDTVVSQGNEVPINSIRSVQPDGSDLRTHYTGRYTCEEIDQGAVSPDGNWVSFWERQDCIQVDDWPTYDSRVCFLNTKTDKLSCTQSFIGGFSGFHPNSWSKDSSRVALYAEDYDYSIDYIGYATVSGAWTTVINSDDWPGMYFDGWAVFNIDESMIYFNARGPDVDANGEPTCEQERSLWGIPVSGGSGPIRISDPSFIGNGISTSNLALQAAFTDNPIYTTYGSQIKTCEAVVSAASPGYICNQLLDTGFGMAFRSPDEKILSALYMDQEVWNLHGLYDDGTVPFPLITDPIKKDAGIPAWSPTNRRLVYLDDSRVFHVAPAEEDYKPYTFSLSQQNVHHLLGWGKSNADKGLWITQPQEGGTVYFKFPYESQPSGPAIQVQFEFLPAILIPQDGDFNIMILSGEGEGEIKNVAIDPLTGTGSFELTPMVTGTFGISVSYVDKSKDEIIAEDVQRFQVEKEYTISVEPSEDTRVLISALHDGIYDSPFQTEDGKISIKVQLYPPDAGVTVYFEVEDPPDSSTYITGSNGDNKDPSANDGTFYPEATLTKQITTNSSGVAVATLEITNHYAGDNYRVKVNLNKLDGSPMVTAYTCTLTAWKLIYLEVDRMCKRGGVLKTDASINDTIIHLAVNSDASASPADNLVENDHIVIFDSQTPFEVSPDIACVKSRSYLPDSNEVIIELADTSDCSAPYLLKGNYFADIDNLGDSPWDFSSGKSAGVCVENSGVFHEDLSTMYLTLDDVFTEYRELTNYLHSSTLPYVKKLPDPRFRVNFSAIWNSYVDKIGDITTFANLNVVQLMMVSLQIEHDATPTDITFGITAGPYAYRNENGDIEFDDSTRYHYSYIYDDSILYCSQDTSLSDLRCGCMPDLTDSQIRPRIINHEFIHNFNVNTKDYGGHCDNYSYDHDVGESDLCLMHRYRWKSEYCSVYQVPGVRLDVQNADFSENGGDAIDVRASVDGLPISHVSP